MNALPGGSGQRKPATNPTPENKPDSDGPAALDNLSLPKLVSFESLSRCGDEVWIENNGEIYRLRRTRQGKLILTK